MGYIGCFHFEMENWELSGCGGEMFPSSGGRTDPGHDFRPRAGVMAPLCRGSQPVPALLLSLTGTGYAAQESKQHLQHSVSSGELLSVLWLLGALEWELLVLSPSPSSSVIVYLLRAHHKPCGASPGKNQLRTVIFMETVKQ